MKLLTIQGLSRLKQKIDAFFLHKGQDETVTGVKTFGTDPLFDDDKRLIDRLFEGNLVFVDVNNGEHIGSAKVEDISNLYYDINTAPAVEGYDFVSMEYSPLGDVCYLFYIPLTNPVATTRESIINYINQGIIPNTKNMTGEFFVNSTELPSRPTEFPRLYTKNMTRISFYKEVETIHWFDITGIEFQNNDYLKFSSTRIHEIPSFDYSIVSSASGMFRHCANLVSLPSIDFPNCTNGTYMFDSCSSLSSIGTINMPKLTRTDYMFQYCSSLVTVPPINSSSITTCPAMFRGCTSLEVVQGLNFSSMDKNSNDWLFQECTSLREVHIDFGNNAKASNIFNNLTFGANQMINLYVKNIPQSVRTAIENNYSAHVTIIDEV